MSLPRTDYGNPVDNTLRISHSPIMSQPIDFKAARAELDITQTELASRLGVAQGDLSNWETGKHAPSRLAREALGLRLAQLLAEHRASRESTPDKHEASAA